MSILRLIARYERVHELIKRKATGSPKELAQRLEVSPSTVKIIIRELIQLGGPIKYCYFSQSYVYTEQVEFEIKFEYDPNEPVL
ncbi:winged helix-turn-helix transcriptional regulator [Algivirga pacifica]|uniref:Helix-turn-helix type 11 domain-containing protein n=1 Tax=Algivirga pacifica TaxID=1162670 RepID=A0ABP9DK92_9BACT